jgi:hypothetical protein
MANYTFSDLRDKVLTWLHGRRFGVIGDAYGADTSLAVLDGVAIGSTRSGASAIKAVAAGHNGAGAVTVAGAVVGDLVEIVVCLNTPADASASFESTVSVAGQVQQTSGSNLSANTYLFCVKPQS